MHKIVLSPLALVLAAVGCAHTAAKPSIDSTPAQVAKAEAPAPSVAAEPQGDERQAMADLEAALRGAVLHFAFDQDGLTADSRSRLERIARILGQHPGLRVRVDGNCDERGTEEFNLALGQRRAEVAKKYLVNLGVDGDRVNTISFGKDRPLADAHDESAWAQNRRDDFEPVGQRL